MEIYEYNPKGVCASKMIFKIDGDTVLDIKIVGGCPGNSLGVVSLCKNQKIDYIIEKLENIKCGFKTTSCPDQIATALKEYKTK